MRSVWLVLLFLAQFSFASSATVAAAPDLQEILLARLQYVYGPVWARGDAAKVADELVTRDVVITAADSSKVWKGRAPALDLVRELLKSYTTIVPKAIYTKSLGPDAALQFVMFDLTASDAAHTKSTAKSLYVWVKTPQGWRVTADHYSYIGMDIP